MTKLRQSRDAPVLAELLEVHAIARPRILDCTYRIGAIWGRLPIREQVIKADINPALRGLDLVCDWLELPLHFGRASIDVQVWDPVHVADVGRGSRVYGRYVPPGREGERQDVTAFYAGFLDVAEWLVKPRSGIVLAKLCDQVHRGRLQWQVFDLVDLARRRGWTACDYRVLHNPGPARDPKWRNQFHARNDVAFWLVLRNGPACQGPGRRLRHQRVCEACGEAFYPRRADARSCGDRCRQRLRRAPV